VADIAKLGIKIDSSQVLIADQRVTNLGNSGKTTEQSTTKLESSWSKFSRTIITVNQGMQLAQRVFGTIKDVVTDLNAAWESNAIADIKLENALKATNYAAGITTLEMQDMANEMVCLLYTSPSPRDATLSRMPSSA